MVLSRDAVFLCLARPDELLVANHRPVVAGFLSPADRSHVDRFRAERDRDLALASRVLQRWALSRATDHSVPPAAWQFSVGSNGRPVIAGPSDWQGLEFSVANTLGLVGCAVSAAHAVGLDLESRRDNLPGELVDRCLAAVERHALFALPERDRADRFMRLWTTKEAYLKARGLGLVEPLSQVIATFDATRRATLQLGAELHDSGERWQSESWLPTNQHWAAICVERPPGAAAVAINQQWVPPLALPTSGARS